MFAIWRDNATSAANKTKTRLCLKKVKACSRDNIDYHFKFVVVFHSLFALAFLLECRCIKRARVCQITSLVFCQQESNISFQVVFSLPRILLTYIAKDIFNWYQHQKERKRRKKRKNSRELYLFNVKY